MYLEFGLYIEKRKYLKEMQKIFVYIFIFFAVIAFLSVFFIQLRNDFLVCSFIISLIINTIFNFFIEDFLYKKIGSVFFNEDEIKIKETEDEIIINLKDLKEIIIHYENYKQKFIFNARFYNETGKNNILKFKFDKRKFKYILFSTEIDDESRLRDILRKWKNSGIDFKYYFKGKELNL